MVVLKEDGLGVSEPEKGGVHLRRRMCGVMLSLRRFTGHGRPDLLPNLIESGSNHLFRLYTPCGTPIDEARRADKPSGGRLRQSSASAAVIRLGSSPHRRASGRILPCRDSDPIP
jgi:hypothetical protein